VILNFLFGSRSKIAALFLMTLDRPRSTLRYLQRSEYLAGTPRLALQSARVHRRRNLHLAGSVDRYRKPTKQITDASHGKLLKIVTTTMMLMMRVLEVVFHYIYRFKRYLKIKQKIERRFNT
jgi:hypothetical protein